MAIDDPDNWSYYSELNINNPSPDYQMRLVLKRGTGTNDPTKGIIYDGGNCSYDDMRDVRVGTDSDPATAEQLPQWAESVDPGIERIIWVKTNGNDTLYIFIGNSGVSEYSDGASTFDYFTDMSVTNPIVTPEWTFANYYDYENGYLRLGVGSWDNQAGDAYLDLTNYAVYGAAKSQLRILMKHNPLGVKGRVEGRSDELKAYVDRNNYHSVSWSNYATPRFRISKKVSGSTYNYATDSTSLPYDNKDRWWLFKVSPDHGYFKKWDYDGTNVYEKSGTPAAASTLNFSKINIHEWQGKWAIKIFALLKYAATEPTWNATNWGVWQEISPPPPPPPPSGGLSDINVTPARVITTDFPAAAGLPKDQKIRVYAKAVSGQEKEILLNALT